MNTLYFIESMPDFINEIEKKNITEDYLIELYYALTEDKHAGVVIKDDGFHVFMNANEFTNFVFDYYYKYIE